MRKRLFSEFLLKNTEFKSDWSEGFDGADLDILTMKEKSEFLLNEAKEKSLIKSESGDYELDVYGVYDGNKSEPESNGETSSLEINVGSELSRAIKT